MTCRTRDNGSATEALHSHDLQQHPPPSPPPPRAGEERTSLTTAGLPLPWGCPRWKRPPPTRTAQRRGRHKTPPHPLTPPPQNPQVEAGE